MVSLRQQCTAKSKATKEQCRRWAIKGGLVCIMHGGSIPKVRESANQRLRDMQYPALAKLQQLIDSEVDSVALGACKDILDRTGLKPPDKLKIEADLVCDPGREKLDDATLKMLIDAARGAKKP